MKRINILVFLLVLIILDVSSCSEVQKPILDNVPYSEADLYNAVSIYSEVIALIKDNYLEETKVKELVFNGVKGAEEEISRRKYKLNKLELNWGNIKDDDFYVRIVSTIALGNIKSRRATAPLTKLLNDDSLYCREVAAVTLGKLRDEKAAVPLIKLLKDRDSYVQEKAVWALGEIGEQAGYALIDALKENNGNVSRVAQAVGLDRRNLQRKFKQYKINPRDYLQ